MSLTEQPDQPARRPMRDMIQRKPRAPQLGAKLKTALRAIVWHGQELAEAAESAGLTTHALRQALAKPHVIQWWRKERDVFTAQARAQNVHHAVRIRGADNAAASMRAVEFIERIGDERAANAGAQAAPGIVIVIGDIAKALNQPANILELQAKALPCEGDTKPDGA